MFSLLDAKLKFSLHMLDYIQAPECQIRKHSQPCVSNPTYACGKLAICSYAGLEMARNGESEREKDCGINIRENRIHTEEWRRMV
jgi:hypothetical protein